MAFRSGLEEAPTGVPGRGRTTSCSRGVVRDRRCCGPSGDLAAFARELLQPTLITADTLRGATGVAFPGLSGVLPGVGPFDPLDWGLGFELRDGKSPHWTGSRNSTGTFGHFGGAGTFMWVDPVLDRALVCVTDRVYDAWALEAWPRLSDAVIDTLTTRD